MGKFKLNGQEKIINFCLLAILVLGVFLGTLFTFPEKARAQTCQWLCGGVGDTTYCGSNPCCTTCTGGTSCNCQAQPPPGNGVSCSCTGGGSGGGGGGSCTVDSQCGTGNRCCPGGTCSSGPCGGVFQGQRCPAGTTLDCTGGIGRGCTRRGVCDSYFPSSWEYPPARSCEEGYEGRCTSGCTCVSPCNATDPTNLAVTSVSPTSSRVTWNPGTGGSVHYLYVSDDTSDLTNYCASGGCIVNGQVVTSPYVVTGLTAGTIYYYRVMNYSSASCFRGSTTASSLTSCSLSPSPFSLAPDETQFVTAQINGSTSIQRVDFSSSNPSVLSVNPPSTSFYSYRTLARGLTPGTATVNATVYSTTGTILCQTNSASFPGSTGAEATIINTSPWWQVEDGDVTAANGGILSAVPAGELFDTIGAGGFPGVPVYTGSLSVSPGEISVRNWNADTPTVLSRVFDYNYFESLIPDSVTPTTVSGSTTLPAPGANMDGYEVFKANGSITMNTVDFGNRKVILLVDNNGNLTINGTINVDNNVGFFGAFVSGSINVVPTVTGTPSLEGIYLTDGGFGSGTGTSQLHLRGSVASLGPINLQRDLPNNVIPAELFEYAPDQILLFPRRFAFMRTRWAEIAP